MIFLVIFPPSGTPDGLPHQNTELLLLYLDHLLGSGHLVVVLLHLSLTTLLNNGADPPPNLPIAAEWASTELRIVLRRPFLMIVDHQHTWW